MTPQEAKELSIKIWTYIAEHPEIKQKWELPNDLYDEIALITWQCPLCKIYTYERSDTGISCRKKCPLYRCPSVGSAYIRWHTGVDEIIRREAALEILDKLKAWEI